ncbi:hypothetical protein CU097_012784 [Rhizopus azygosporus]|uniref:Pre-mRNA-splicing factor SYF2 n=1 Tax=Rhizopus azygosporus TaxID=86630 RepID=A0A367JP74_RHIAZ|nr:hypothetical protein CU097_012784 [Rhizopus azygosporus]
MAAKKRAANNKKTKAVQEEHPSSEPEQNTNMQEELPKKRQHDEIQQETEQEESKSSTTSSLEEKMAKLKQLQKRRATEVEQSNRRDRNLEFQRSKENPRLEAKLERKKEEALKLLEKQEARDNGEDFERKQFWKYSAESAEAWEKKQAKKAKMANNGFTDYTQLAHKKYVRLMSEFKPDLSTYKEKQLEVIERAIRNGEDPSDVVAMANSLDYASVNDKPSKEAIEKLAAETKKQIEKRETRSRERKEIVDDISWINEKNRVFNQKIARFYDKYTKEIRENLERGTAL